jgi:hypothetical protein
MATIIGLIDGTTIEVEHEPDRVIELIDDTIGRATLPTGQSMRKAPVAYGKWLMLGDKAETHFNPAHVVYVRKAASRKLAF